MHPARIYDWAFLGRAIRQFLDTDSVLPTRPGQRRGGGAAVRLIGYVSGLTNWIAITTCP